MTASIAATMFSARWRSHSSALRNAGSFTTSLGPQPEV
jgi:hypothetical protein